MLKEINNGKRYLIALLGLVLFCSLSFIPIGFGIIYEWTIYLPYVGLAITIAIIIIIRPSYFFIGIKNNQILIKTNPVDDDYIIINKEEFAGFELKRKLFGIKYELVIFKKHPKGILKSEALNVFFPGKKNKIIIENILNAFKISH